MRSLYPAHVLELVLVLEVKRHLKAKQWLKYTGSLGFVLHSICGGTPGLLENTKDHQLFWHKLFSQKYLTGNRGSVDEDDGK